MSLDIIIFIKIYRYPSETNKSIENLVQSKSDPLHSPIWYLAIKTIIIHAFCKPNHNLVILAAH